MKWNEYQLFHHLWPNPILFLFLLKFLLSHPLMSSVPFQIQHCKKRMPVQLSQLLQFRCPIFCLPRRDEIHQEKEKRMWDLTCNANVIFLFFLQGLVFFSSFPPASTQVSIKPTPRKNLSSVPVLFLFCFYVAKSKFPLIVIFGYVRIHAPFWCVHTSFHFCFSMIIFLGGRSVIYSVNYHVSVSTRSHAHEFPRHWVHYSYTTYTRFFT